MTTARIALLLGPTGLIFSSCNAEPADGSGGGPTDTGYVVPTYSGLVSINDFDLVRNLELAQTERCLEAVTLVVEHQYWELYAEWAASETSPDDVCVPVGWTAVHDGQCIFMMSTCAGDPRDPSFLDCSTLANCCDDAEGLRACDH